MNHNAIPHDAHTTTATPTADKPPVAAAVPRHRFAVGLDVALHYCVTAIQCDHGGIKAAQKLTRAKLVKWVREQVAAGAKSLITTPVKLSPDRLEGKICCSLTVAARVSTGCDQIRFR